MPKIIIADMMILMYPPVSKYPTPPSDQPGCVLEKCQECKSDIWVSAKKREIRDQLKEAYIYARCYDCLVKKADEDPAFFRDHVRVDS